MNLQHKSLFFLVVALALPASAQDQRGPSTREERADAVRYAKSLERDPFQKDAKKLRQQFLDWLSEIPDITVDLCPGYLEPLYAKKKKNFASVITNQMLFSSAAYMIDHPDQAEDKVAVNLAGLEGALRTYEAILRKKPKARWEYLDELIARRDKGELEAYVREVAAAKCQGKK